MLPYNSWREFPGWMTAKCLIIKRIAKGCVSGSRRSVENRKALTLLAAGRASAFRLRLAGTFPVWAAGPTAGSMFAGDQIFLRSLNGPAWVFAFLASSIQHLDDKKAERTSGAAHEGIGQIGGLACCVEPRAVPVRGWAPQT